MSFVWRPGWSNRIFVPIFIKYGSKDVRALNFRSIQPLVVLEPHGRVWLVNQIKSLRIIFNHIFLRGDTVPKILNSIDQTNFKPCGSEVSGWIVLKLSTPTSFEPFFIKIQTRIWFDHPGRQTNDILIFNFRMKIKNHVELLWLDNMFHISFESSLEAKSRESYGMTHTKNWICKMSNLDKVIFFAILISMTS